MKLLSVLASAALAIACMTSVSSAQQLAGLYDEAGFAPVPVVGQELKITHALRRNQQTSGSATTDSPATTAPASTTETPVTTTPTPTTTAPTPTTTAPTPTTATPTTSEPASTTPTPTSTTATPTSTTATPGATTATPDATTATPWSTTATPTSTTATPTSTTATPSATSTASSSSSSTVAPTATKSATTSNSGSASSSDTSSGSSMSTGAVIGIVVGIVAAVAIIATVIMCVIRRRRETEDDPLSPFELSMDKGYNPTPGGFTAQNSHNQRALGAAGTGASASGSMSNTQTPPADPVAAGVAYSQFYDGAATSPGSMNHHPESNVDSVQTANGNANTTNGTNLWLSAMEPKDNDSYLSAHESPHSSINSSRNSYDMSSNLNIDVDQSSQISGNSNKESDDFPDHHKDNDSARGSYEL